MAFEVYRHHLPHARLDGALYFVTWRTRTDRSELSPEDRDLVASVLRHFDGLRYTLHAYVVMNDHVHVLVDPHPGFRLEAILHSWKSFSARRIGRLRHHGGSVWQTDYFDRVVWSASEYQQKFEYILANPFHRWPALQTYRWCWAIGIKPQ